jgi:hypothetical protein
MVGEIYNTSPLFNHVNWKIFRYNPVVLFVICFSKTHFHCNIYDGCVLLVHKFLTRTFFLKLQHAQNLPETNQEVQEPLIEDIEPPKEVSCPICLNSFVEEMATKCGHIFCKSCIKKAIKSRPAKCLVCRQKITSRGLRRVFLPF